MTVLVVTGSSGGHIFPALSLLEILKARQGEIRTLLVLPKTGAKSNIIEGVKVKYISIRSIKLRLAWRNIVALFCFIKGSFESLFLLLEFKPDIVVGFGTLNCLPLVTLAWLFRIKSLIHEQNVIPGRANLLLAKICDRMAISFEQTKDYLKPQRAKVVLTGNPLRSSLQRVSREEASRFFGFSGEKFTILVAGGSQASHSINTGFLEASAALAAGRRPRVIHITGDEDYAFLDSAYRNLGIEAKLFTFLDQMQYAYSLADIAVCRGGATTIAELIHFLLPAIIIPYPYAYRHQAANAAVLEEKGAARVISDKALNSVGIKKELEDILDNPEKLRNMRLAFNSFSGAQADYLLMQEVLSLYG